MLVAFKRLPRLGVPVLAASLITCTLANMGAFANVHRMESQYAQRWWRNQVDYTWTSNWHAALGVSLPPFAGPFPANVLWTLQGELVGSMFVFALAPAFTLLCCTHTESGKTDALRRSAVLHILVLSLMVCFSFYERRSPEVFEGSLKLIGFTPNASWNQLWRVLFLFEAGFAFEQLQAINPPVSFRRAWLSVSLVLLGLSTVFVAPQSGSFWIYEDYVTVGGVLLVYGTLLMPDKREGGCNQLEIFGKIAFGIYLLHGTIFYSIGFSMYLTLRAWNFDVGFAYCCCLILCLALIVPVSYLFWLCVEKPFAIDLPCLVWKLASMRVKSLLQRDTTGASEGPALC
mmetsp:Transcript_30480/g.55619  ORF Transcript_30480/g.55619 Transcript_30480/m.55619 type:complete len:344 (+) Transcript_30480:2-1033(+)